MRWNNVHIESIAHLLPPTVVTSDEVEQAMADTMKRLGVPKGRLEGLTGIHERRLWGAEVQPSEVGAEVGKLALEKAGKDGLDLDLLISTSIIRDYIEPSTASLIGNGLGVGHDCSIFDISHACLGFVEGLIQAANAIELGHARYAMVVTGENFGMGIRDTIKHMASDDCGEEYFRANFATLTLGCAAVAVILTHKDLATTDRRIVGAVARSATEHSGLCYATKAWMRADPQGLRVHGIDLVAETWPFFVEELGWDTPDIDQWLCHQVGVRHITTTLERLDQPIDKTHIVLDRLGNCGSAALPIAWALADHEGKIGPGDKLCFYSVGSGLGSILMGVQW